MSRRNNRLLVLVDAEHRLQIVLQNTNYSNVAYDLLLYNLASATVTIENRIDVIVTLSTIASVLKIILSWCFITVAVLHVIDVAQRVSEPGRGHGKSDGQMYRQATQRTYL